MEELSEEPRKLTNDYITVRLILDNNRCVLDKYLERHGLRLYNPEKDEITLDQAEQMVKRKQLTHSLYATDGVNYERNFNNFEDLHKFAILSFFGRQHFHELIAKFSPFIRKLVQTENFIYYKVEDDSLVNVYEHFETNPNFDRFPRAKAKLKIGNGIVGQAAYARKTIIITNYEGLDKKYHPKFDAINGSRIDSAICFPLINENGRCYGVIRTDNFTPEPKFDGTNRKDDYCAAKILLIDRYLEYLVLAVQKVEEYESMIRKEKIIKGFNDINAISVVAENNIPRVVGKVSEQIYKLLNAKWIQIFVSDAQATDELIIDEQQLNFKMKFRHVFEFSSTDLQFFEQNKYIKDVKLDDLSYPFASSFFEVATESKGTINIPDLRQYFAQKQDKENMKHCYVTNSALCSMVYSGDETSCIGFVIAGNIAENGPFSKEDQSIFESLILQLSISLQNNNSKLQTNFNQRLRVVIQNSFLQYLKPDEKQVFNLNTIFQIPNDPDAYDLLSSGFTLSTNAATKDAFEARCIISMFVSLNLSILPPIKTLITFVLTVQKLHRTVPFHNFEYSVLSLQTVFFLHTRHRLREVEIYSLMLATLCQILDHSGTNNAIEKKRKSNLARLYDSAYLERHHIAIFFMTLDNKETNVLAHLSDFNYRTVIQRVQSLILSLNKAKFFGFMDKINEYNKQKDDLLRSPILVMKLFIIGGSMSYLTKEWKYHFKWVNRLFDEMFSIGDVERFYFKKTTNILDRHNRKMIPNVVLSIIKHLAIPVFEYIVKLNKKFEKYKEMLEFNMVKWDSLNYQLLDDTIIDEKIDLDRD
ncbi:hypothetical protein SNEBB_004749 [Seison nebaliae]|nr:hypothetical protein SNEBB_004749 [Seison nebaliae]